MQGGLKVKLLHLSWETDQSNCTSLWPGYKSWFCNAMSSSKSEAQDDSKSHTHHISSLAPLMQEPSPLSHVSLTTVLKSTTSSSPPCAPHAGVSLSPYSCKFQPSPPALQLQLLRPSRSILTILPTHIVQSFTSCYTQLWPCPNPWGRYLTKLHSEACADTTVCIHEPGHRATRNAYTIAAGATFLPEECVWAQAVSISLPRN